MPLTISGTHTGDLMGMPPTGRKMAMDALNIFHLAGGKVREQWINADMMGMMQQLGVGATAA